VCAQSGRQFAEVAFNPQTACCKIRRDVDSRRWDALASLEFRPVTTRKLEQDRLDVLASTEPINAKIGAVAVKLP